jgi:hypothetical protein
MFAFLPALLGGLATVMGSLVGRVLLALGIGYLTFSGIDLAVTSITDGIKTNMTGLGSQAISFLSYLWVDKAVSMIISAYGVSLAFKLAGGSSVKKMVVK